MGGLPVLLSDVDAWSQNVYPMEADNALASTSLQGVMAYARYVHQLAEPDAPLRQAVRRGLAHARRGALAVDIGCSVGADLRALREVATHVIGLDMFLPVLRLARAQIDGQPIPWPTRTEGRRFHMDEPRRFAAASNVTLAIGDALDLPLRDQSADVVLALNILDNVSSPLQLLGEIDRIITIGGVLVLGSPFAWQEHITPIDHQLGGVPNATHPDTPSMLASLLADYDIVRREDAPWVLRDHKRASFHYDVHVVTAVKRGPRQAMSPIQAGGAAKK